MGSGLAIKHLAACSIPPVAVIGDRPRLNLKYKALALRHISIENVGRDGILVYIIEQAEHSASHLVQ